MRLIYTFDGESFDFPSLDDPYYVKEQYEDEAADYIIRSHTYDDILQDYIDYIYSTDSEDVKKDLEEFGFYGTEESIRNMSEEDKEDLTNQIIKELIELDIYNDELMDYFEDEAYERYSETADNQDPYDYNGVKRSDF